MGNHMAHEGQEKTNRLKFRLHRRRKKDEQFSVLVVHRDLFFQNKCRPAVQEGTASTKVAREHYELTGNEYEVRILRSEPQLNLPNNYNSALAQLHSMERRFQWNPNITGLCQQ